MRTTPDWGPPGDHDQQRWPWGRGHRCPHWRSGPSRITVQRNIAKTRRYPAARPGRAAIQWTPSAMHRPSAMFKSLHILLQEPQADAILFIHAATAIVPSVEVAAAVAPFVEKYVRQKKPAQSGQITLTLCFKACARSWARRYARSKASALLAW